MASTMDDSINSLQISSIDWAAHADVLAKPIEVETLGDIGPDTDGILFPPSVPLGDLWSMYYTLQRVGPEGVSAFVNLGLYLTGIRDFPPDLKTEILNLLRGLKNIGGTKQAKDFHETLVSFTYVLLRCKQLTYTEAAQLATAALGKPIKPNAWRMRVDRWAEKQGLPKVEQRKRDKA